MLLPTADPELLWINSKNIHTASEQLNSLRFLSNCDSNDLIPLLFDDRHHDIL